jgi:hypothetical protein
MSSHQVSGAIAYQEGQGSNQVHRWRAFAVLAVSFFMTIADLAIVNVALPTIGRKLHMPNRACNGSSPATRSPSAASCCSAAAPRTCSGRRRILMAGLFVFTAASLAAGWRHRRGS